MSDAARRPSAASDDFRRLEAAFHEARRLDADARRALLEHLDAEDPQLAAQLRRMLGAAEADTDLPDAKSLADELAVELADELLDSRSDGPTDARRRLDPTVPERVGHYRIIRLIGQGGMGQVYEAEQESPRRRVALKVIRADLWLGLSSDQLLRRFMVEAAALGRLQHPAIAQIHEAGTDPDTRRPFFVMELVDGKPLLEHVRAAKLDQRQRVALLADIADAVEYAHTHGVIHRDLKPGNILVSRAGGSPKILDFGMARIAGGDAQNTVTLRTDVGQLIGTLPYMSPEQVEGDPARIDARSDVYALGVILYELLCGRLPHDVRGLTIPEAARRIREDEPTRLGSVDRALRGDLETVVSAALAKEPSRRYPSAGALAADLRRWLHDEPVAARPPSGWYQFSKFARRNRALVGGVAAVIVTLFVSTVALALLAARVVEERNLAEERAYRANLMAAQAALGQGDHALALRTLELAPEHLRGWEWRHLSWRADPAERRLEGFGGPIATVAARSGTDLVVAANHEGRVALWDLAASDLASSGPRWITTIDGATFKESVPTLAIAPGGVAVLWADDERAVMLDAISGIPSWRIDGHLSIGRHPFDGAGHLLVGRLDGFAVELRDVRSAEVVRTYPMPEPPWLPTFAGARLDEVDHDATPPTIVTWLRVDNVTAAFDYRDGALRWRTHGRFADGHAMRDSVLIGWEHGPFPHDLMTGAPRTTGAPQRPELNTAWVAPDGRMALLAAFGSGRDGTVGVHETLTGRRLGAVPGRTATVLDGRLVSGDDTGTLRVTDLADLGQPFTVPMPQGPPRRAAVDPVRRVVTNFAWGLMRVVDADTGRMLWSLPVTRRPVTVATFSPDGTRLAVGAERGEIAIVDMESRSIVVRRPPEPDRADIVAISWFGVAPPRVTPSGIAALNASGRFEILGGTVLDPAAPIEPPEGISTAIARTIAPDRFLVGGQGALWVLDVEGFWHLTRLPVPDTVRWIELAPDDDTVALATDRGVLLGSLSRGRFETLPESDGQTTRLRFSPDGRRLVAMRNGGLRVWHLPQRRVSVELTLPSTATGDFAFLDDRSERARLVIGGSGHALMSLDEGPTMDEPRSTTARRVVSTAAVRLASVAQAWMLDEVRDAARVLVIDDPEVRAELEHLLATMGEDPNYLNSLAWGVVRRPGRSEEELRRGLAHALRANELWPDDRSMLSTLAFALHRSGRDEEALAAIARADALPGPTGDSLRVTSAILKTLVHAQLGDHDSARAALAEAEAVAARMPADPEMLTLLAEARAAAADL